MRPLADAAAAAAATDDDCCDETNAAGNDENASAAANAGHAMPSRAGARQAKRLCSAQPFLKAVANAAALAKVRILPIARLPGMSQVLPALRLSHCQNPFGIDRRPARYASKGCV